MARDLLIGGVPREWRWRATGKMPVVPVQRKGKDEMKTKKQKLKRTKESDELTLESWRAERRQMESEMAADSAQLKAAMEEALANDDLPPEMRKIIRESGTKLLEADEWLREMYDSTEDTIKRCDELIAKVDALEVRRGGKSKKRESEA